MATDDETGLYTKMQGELEVSAATSAQTAKTDEHPEIAVEELVVSPNRQPRWFTKRSAFQAVTVPAR